MDFNFRILSIRHPAWIASYQHMGFNPGNAFTVWLSSVLGSAQIFNLGQLKGRVDEVPAGMVLADGRAFDATQFPRKLKLVSAELITQSKVVFPKDASLFWVEPDKLPPAVLVRTSTSIPIFFEPVHLTQLPVRPIAEWRKLGYEGTTAPHEAMFVDGGVVSNFPINLFHSPGVPEFPTFVVKLGFDRVEAKRTKSPPEMIGNRSALTISGVSSGGRKH